MKTIPGHLYDYPKYYDLVFGSDWKAEFDFLEGVFEKHVSGKVRRLLEPACGTGRLMYRFGKAGYAIAGNDLNEKAVAFCNARLKRHGLKPTAVVGDMADFKLADFQPNKAGAVKPFDAAFNTINSFRHLPSEGAAEGHLRSVAAALRPGGVYVLGLHLTPARGEPESDEESWSARRGQLCVASRLWSEGVDRRKRVETVGMSFDVYTPTESFRLVDQTGFRTYTARQMEDLFGRIGGLSVAAVYDFAYDLREEVEIGPETEDVVYVLRRS